MTQHLSRHSLIAWKQQSGEQNDRKEPQLVPIIQKWEKNTVVT